MAESKALYLGKYYAVEKNTQDSFVLSTEKYPFELTYKDQETEIVVNSQTVENQRQKARVSLYKEYEPYAIRPIIRCQKFYSGFMLRKISWLLPVMLVSKRIP